MNEQMDTERLPYEKEIRSFLKEREGNSVFCPEESWPLLDREDFFLSSESAFELGGRGLAAVSGLAFTENTGLLPESGVTVLGPDLDQIRQDCAYARITLVRLRQGSISCSEPGKCYSLLKKIDYTRYHLYPEGYMMRISSRKEREPVRVSKAAVKKGISFLKIGNAMIRAYRKHPEVEAVGIWFITAPGADYDELRRTAVRFEEITNAMNTIFRGISMDCTSCSQKAICDEVEELRRLHLGR